MPTDLLAAQQQRFMALLYALETAAATPLVRSGGISAEQRFAVYRNNLASNFLNVMTLEFPVIQKLTGAAYFRQLAAEFQHSCPSRSGNLHHIGAPFSNWLTARFADSDYPWFADVAALEWAWQECYVAGEPNGRADLTRLAELSETQQESLRLELHPACRIVRSRWPVMSIWSAHQHSATTDMNLASLDMTRAENCLILRHAGEVILHSLSDGEAILLGSLQKGDTLGLALEQAVEADADFGAGAALHRAATLGLFTAISTQ